MVKGRKTDKEKATGQKKAKLLKRLDVVEAFRQSGKTQYTPKRLAGMQATADLRAADRNPYSWNMEYFPYADGSGFEAHFSRCGICTLMKELGLYDLTPALCHMDYTMADAGGATTFVREYTLASGGPYCDCGYHKKQ